ncbi:MAG: DoxX family protein [Pseudomonadota bacterium]
MNSITAGLGSLYDRCTRVLAHFDGVPALLLRLILGPVLIAAGWEKLSGENWFAGIQGAMPFPFHIVPVEISWFLASWTEFLGGIALLLGLGTRIIALPLAVVMFVAGYSVHLSNGWAAIAPSNPPALCTADRSDPEAGGWLERVIRCQSVNERTIEASERLRRAKGILRRHGNYAYLNGNGAIVKLNSGIEFSAIYFAMLLSLMAIGGGRYLSLDYFLARRHGRDRGRARGLPGETAFVKS